MRAILSRERPSIIAAEVLGLALLVGAAGFIPGASPGFLELYGLPVLAAGPLFAAFYGFGWGCAAMALSGVSGFLGAPALVGELNAAWFASLAATLPVPGLASLSLMAAAGFARGRSDRSRAELLGRLKDAVVKAIRLERATETLERVNRELENRVAGQGDSVTLLHDSVRKLASLNLDEALASILDTVELFSGARCASIWLPDEADGRLNPVAVKGWRAGEARDTALDPETSVEGWALRNRKPFSARMAASGPPFDRLDCTRAIMAFPLVIKGKPWAVLVIEDLPFERYSLYTESLLAIVLSLAEPYLRTIVEYEALRSRREVDEETGYPGFPVLVRTLERELATLGHEQAALSLVIIEMANFAAILDGGRQRQELKRLVAGCHRIVDRSEGSKSLAFHFKDDSQLALLVPGLGQGDVSFYCLELLGTLAAIPFEIDGEGIPFEAIIGFASVGADTRGADAESMISEAEHLLSLQRI
ncbi:MAG: GAF domain-containing protein [Spirochaetales bacterium]|nr:GAF domain-containing protein [Spirochaetales bacterium]